MLGTREGLRQGLRLGISEGNERGFRIGPVLLLDCGSSCCLSLHIVLFVFQFEVPPHATTTATNMFVRSMFVQVLFTFVLSLIFSQKNKIKTGVTWNLACSFEVIFHVVVSFVVLGIFVCVRGSIPRPNSDRVHQDFL
jgi:hypothetical protein